MNTPAPIFHYHLYGLSLVSDLAFPELVESAEPPGRPDGRIRLTDHLAVAEPRRWFLESTLPDGESWLKCAKADEGGVYLLRYPGLADFVVNKARREIISIRPEAGPFALTLRHLLLDSVMPLFLNLIGREAMHATAIETDRGVCAFTGPAGTGKSTLAGAFVKAGYRLVCDDCLTLEERGGAIFALPGYRGLRLWLDSLEAMGGEAEMLMPVAGYTSKSRYLGAGEFDRFCDEPAPLMRIYSLSRETDGDTVRGDRPAPRIEALSGSETLMEVVEKTYRLDVTDRAMLERQFRFLARVVAEVPVKRLYLPNALDGLPAVLDAVLRDLAQS